MCVPGVGVGGGVGFGAAILTTFRLSSTIRLVPSLFTPLTMIMVDVTLLGVHVKVHAVAVFATVLHIRGTPVQPTPGAKSMRAAPDMENTSAARAVTVIMMLDPSPMVAEVAANVSPEPAG
jgi:hypothetical protein